MRAAQISRSSEPFWRGPARHAQFLKIRSGQMMGPSPRRRAVRDACDIPRVRPEDRHDGGIVLPGHTGNPHWSKKSSSQIPALKTRAIRLPVPSRIHRFSLPARWGRCLDGLAKRAQNPRGCVKGGFSSGSKMNRACRVATPSLDGPGLNPAALKGLVDKRPGVGIGGS